MNPTETTSEQRENFWSARFYRGGATSGLCLEEIPAIAKIIRDEANCRKQSYTSFNPLEAYRTFRENMNIEREVTSEKKKEIREKLQEEHLIIYDRYDEDTIIGKENEWKTAREFGTYVTKVLSNFCEGANIPHLEVGGFYLTLPQTER